MDVQILHLELRVEDTGRLFSRTQDVSHARKVVGLAYPLQVFEKVAGRVKDVEVVVWVFEQLRHRRVSCQLVDNVRHPRVERLGVVCLKRHLVVDDEFEVVACDVHEFGNQVVLLQSVGNAFGSLADVLEYERLVHKLFTLGEAILVNYLDLLQDGRLTRLSGTQKEHLCLCLWLRQAFRIFGLHILVHRLKSLFRFKFRRRVGGLTLLW